MNKKRKKPKLTFLDVLHLAEIYCEQYNEKKLCLSQEQDDSSFRDFVRQYCCALFWDTPINLVIDPEAPLDTPTCPLYFPKPSKKGK